MNLQNRLRQIDHALDRADTETAARIAGEALAAGLEDPLILNLVAWRLEEDGDLDAAVAHIQRALALAPQDPTIHVAHGIVLRKTGELRESVAAFERAIALDPAYAAAWMHRGSSFEKGGALADAADDYRHSLGLDPRNPDALASLASLEARRGNIKEARDNARLALSLEPSHAIARQALAQAALESGDAERARELLEAILADAPADGDFLVGTHSLLGDTLAKLGRHDEAFDCYARAQAQFQAIHSARQSAETARDAVDFVQTIARSFSALPDPAFAALRGRAGTPISGPDSGNRAKRHVILTGYPRSGTTLVENILASLPGAVAIEERPTLARIDREFLTRADGVEALFSAAPEVLDSLRSDYWQRAARAAGVDLTDRVFIDMDPFKGSRLPAIGLLFPQAKVVVMRRDPRDVVWSCFHTSFAYNAGTLAFSSLDSTARHFAATWTTIDLARERLAIDAFDLRYDRLVRAFDETTRALCAFLGVEWSEALRDFAVTARRRGVSTASVTQVRQGLYDGSGSWRPYARQMESVEPILRPWIERYEADAV